MKRKRPDKKTKAIAIAAAFELLKITSDVGSIINKKLIDKTENETPNNFSDSTNLNKKEK